MRSQVQRAPRSEILDHLEDLLGLDATQIAVQVANLSRVGNSEAAFTTLKTYDATLGGVGVYSITDKHPPGVYRALFYVDMFLRQPGAENHSRFIILSACG